MAALTEAEWKARAIAELDPTDAAGLAAVFDTYWVPAFNRWGTTSLELTTLLAEQQALRYVLGFYSQKRDWSANGVSSKDSQVFDHLQQLAASLPAQIAALLAQISGSGGAKTGEMVTTAPIMQTGWGADPNDTFYAGNPLRRNVRWP